MPFSLKNIEVTYQRAMNCIFHDMMHNIVEDYIDDLLAKSNIYEEYWEGIYRIFHRLLEYNIQLNPKKCIFSVTLAKLLGFIMSK